MDTDITKQRLDIIAAVAHTFRFMFNNYDGLLKIWLFFYLPTVLITQLVMQTFTITKYPLLGILPLILNVPLLALGTGAVIDLLRAKTYGFQFSIRKTLKEGWYKLILTNYLLTGLMIVGEILKIFGQKSSGMFSLLYSIVTILGVFIFQVVRTTGKWGWNAYAGSIEVVMANKLMIILYWILNAFMLIGTAVVFKRFTSGDLTFDTPFLIAKSLFGVFQVSLSSVLYINLTENPIDKATKIKLVKPVT